LERELLDDALAAGVTEGGKAGAVAGELGDPAGEGGDVFGGKDEA
jgi:hypothetical protein